MKNKQTILIPIIVVFFLLINIFSSRSQVINECKNWQASHPDWIFCDDFESGVEDQMVRQGRYFEYSDNNGDFISVVGIGFGNSIGMRTIFQKGEVDAGGMKLGFGRNPIGYMNKGIRSTEDFREVYYRMYLRNDSNWEGNPAKLSRATVFTNPSVWSQAMIAHLWSDSNYHLLLDPASGVNEKGEIATTKYNDFANLRWLGNKRGVTPIFDGKHDDWICIEHHVKLNDPGKKNGIQEFWIDGNLEARITDLDFVGTYDAYAINAIFFENYWNDGSVKLQERYFDNIVVSTSRIGCLDLSTNTDIKNKNMINVYPNPTTEKINFHIPQQRSQEVTLLDINSKILISLKNQDQIGSIDISHLTNGIYFLRISTVENVFTYKIIKV